MSNPTDLPDCTGGHFSGKLPKTVLSVRWRIGFCGFMAMFFLTSLRLNFSVGISCMVDLPSSVPLDGAVSNQSVTGTGIGGTENFPWNENKSSEYNSTIHQSKAFPWHKQTQATLLSAFTYGYLILLVPGGSLSRRYGSRRVMGVSLLVSLLCTTLTPVCARTNIYLLFAVRVAIGAAVGLSYPALFSLAVRWIPHAEMTRFITMAISGMPIGRVVTFPVSGLLCEYGFDDGWGSIFYVFAIACVPVLIVWYYVVYDSPLKHPRISPAEKEYIISKLGKPESKTERQQFTPWLSILSSPPVWACALGYFGVDWINNTFQLGIILYMKEALEFEITSSGVFSSLIFIAMCITTISVGFLSDGILKKKLMSKVNARRLFQLLSFIPMGILMIVISFLTKENAEWAVACLIIAHIFFGLSRGGFLISVMDFAPTYSAEISGMLNLVGNITGLLVPLAIGKLTPNGTQAEWRTIFVMGGGIAIFTGVGFSILARGEIQPWAQYARPEIEIMVEEKSSKSTEKM